MGREFFVMVKKKKGSGQPRKKKKIPFKHKPKYVEPFKHLGPLRQRRVVTYQEKMLARLGKKDSSRE